MFPSSAGASGHLWPQGVGVGRHRVRRLLRLMGLQAIYRRPGPPDRIPSTGLPVPWPR